MSDPPIEKTNAMRLLDQRKIAYQAVAYGEPGVFHTAIEVATMLGQPPAAVLKTIVVLREKGKPLLVIIAADREIDPRHLAKAIGDKKLHVAPRKDAERLTGLQVGGITALALLNKGFEVVIDAPALQQDTVYVSAGRRGTQIRLDVQDLVQVTSARVVHATNPEGAPPSAEM